MLLLTSHRTLKTTGSLNYEIPEFTKHSITRIHSNFQIKIRIGLVGYQIATNGSLIDMPLSVSLNYMPSNSKSDK